MDHDQFITPPPSPTRDIELDHISEVSEVSTLQYIFETVAKISQTIQENICGKNPDQDSEDPKWDFTDGRNTFSSGGRPTNECRAPIHPSMRRRNRA